MKTLSHLIELFEKEASFLNNWIKNPFLAVKNQNLSFTGPGGEKTKEAINQVQHRAHLKKQAKLFCV